MLLADMLMPHPIVRVQRTGIRWKTPSMSARTVSAPVWASCLLPALITAAQACGMRQMIAVIGDSANHSSIGLHRRFGFHDAGLLRDVGFKFDRWLDTVFMQRSLLQD